MSSITPQKLFSGHAPCMSYVENTRSSSQDVICDIPTSRPGINDCRSATPSGLRWDPLLSFQVNKYLSTLPVSPKVSLQRRGVTVSPAKSDFLIDSFLEFLKLSPMELISKIVNWLFPPTQEDKNQMSFNSPLTGPIRTLSEKSLYGVYYGSWNNKLIQEVTGETNKKKYDLVIVHPSNINPGQVAKLKSSDTLVFCYLSVGEDKPFHPGATWYYDSDRDGRPDKNGAWESYYVNVSDPHWHQALRTYHNSGDQHWYGYDYSINTLGCDGLFLDNLDTVSPAIWGGRYAGELNAMINLIAEIRFNLPDIYLIANRGLFYLNPFNGKSNPHGLKEITPAMREQFITSINGILFENFTKEPDREDWAKILNANNDKLTLFSLDYPPMDVGTACHIADQYKWLSHVSQKSLGTFVHEVRDHCPD